MIISFFTMDAYSHQENEAAV